MLLDVGIGIREDNVSVWCHFCESIEDVGYFVGWKVGGLIVAVIDVPAAVRYFLVDTFSGTYQLVK